MWVFYLISLPLTLGMVVVTLRYFAGPAVPRYVVVTVGYAWFCSLSIIILVPADIWQTLTGSAKGGIGFFWSWSYWSTFILTWAVVPTIQGYEDAGDFTVKERLKTSIHMNLLFYSIVGAIGLIGLILLLIMHKAWDGGIVGFAMACSNTFGLVTGAFLLGFGLSEIPRNIWKNADWSHRQKVLSHRVAKMAVKLDNAHQEYSNAIVVAQATSNQMSKRDILRPYMDIIDNMLSQMLREDPAFKPSGGRLGENDMDYDTDDKSMATLRRQLRRAHEEYYRCKSEYMTCVMEALKLEDTIKNYERRDANGWKYVSSFSESRSGTLGSILDTIEFIWCCILRKQLQKAFAVILGCMSAAILLAEATLLPSGVDLSLFSILIKAVGKQEVLVQVAAFVPLMYMCICTYYSLFKIGMLMFYSLTPRQTSSVSLLMICSMVARYAPPISYNFLNLIRLGGNAKTTFEKRMGNIDDAVPFFGRGFNKIYPLIMVVYTLLVASNFFVRVIDFLGRWKRFKFQREEENIDGLDPSGMIILQKERSWIEQGCKVGEQVIPLARNFNGVNADIESQNVPLVENTVEMKVGATSSRNDGRAGQLKYANNRETIASKYTSIREQNRQSGKVVRKEISPNSISLLEERNSEQGSNAGVPPTGVSATWASMKIGFQNFKANMGSKKFLPLRQDPGFVPNLNVSSPESLDDIFQRLKRRPANVPVDYLDDDDDDNIGDTDLHFQDQ
ncbi:LMBR1 domain-containing protein 2 homolog A isoform X1 [Zea mays]|uniref:LMBR1-like membrane protein n=6 Tax=Zea mays TaxID=4577 RepID=A0A1D6HKV8_MAIZE|nr:LMBR1 domain-containing protein 2 homolog A isoform X1 [Zea mays]AQK75066.1 LMBR1-like membrane protein [Zea mays]|eukprot:XP_020394287.1 LMBR1 domain-containing protein 2 homolog A isoform X1 [Zea mays]